MIHSTEEFWELMQRQLTGESGGNMHVYFRSSEGVYEGLPLVFRGKTPYVSMEKVLDKARSLPEPFKTGFLKRYQQDKFFTLAAATKHYWGPLYRPNRETHLYIPTRDLFLAVQELEERWPELEEQDHYGDYWRIEKVIQLYNNLEKSRKPGMAEEKEAEYTPASQIFPLNQILYGPPGTGKTYQTVAYAVAIIEGKEIEQIQAEPREDVRRRYELYHEQEQIEFITFHQSYSYEEFVQGLRPDTHRHTDSLHFRLVDGIFKRLADRAKANYEAYRKTIHRSRLSFDTLLDQMLMESMNRDTEEVEIPLFNPSGQFKSLIIYEVGETFLTYKRRTTKGVVRSEERVLYLHKLREGFYGKDIREAINRSYYEAVVQAVKKFETTRKQAVSDDQLRNYVLIIDEINRANISRVFGELITLLEEDKRLGNENQLTITLPSGESFAVPCNVYLIGTMNTADKSIALLDVALRRRFVFVPMYPVYDLIPDFEAFLRQLNTQIYERKGADYLIGHSYFLHKKPEELADICNQKIIPLLYEYFNNRTEQVQEILRNAGVTVVQENYQLRAR